MVIALIAVEHENHVRTSEGFCQIEQSGDRVTHAQSGTELVGRKRREMNVHRAASRLRVDVETMQDSGRRCDDLEGVSVRRGASGLIRKQSSEKGNHGLFWLGQSR